MQRIGRVSPTRGLPCLFFALRLTRCVVPVARCVTGLTRGVNPLPREATRPGTVSRNPRALNH